MCYFLPQLAMGDGGAVVVVLPAMYCKEYIKTILSSSIFILNRINIIIWSVQININNKINAKIIEGFKNK